MWRSDGELTMTVAKETLIDRRMLSLIGGESLLIQIVSLFSEIISNFRCSDLIGSATTFSAISD